MIVVAGGTGMLDKSYIKGIMEARGAAGISGGNATAANERAATINNNGGKAVALVAGVFNEA